MRPASEASAPAPEARWRLPFFSLWAGQALSLFGSALVQFALIWWLTTTTRSATVLALAALAGMLPQVVLGPFSGVLVDRFSRRAIMLVADGLVALATAGLAVLFALGVIQVWHVYLALFLRATAGTFQFPAMQASASLMVPDKHLSRVAGLNQSLQGLLSIAAPPLGALLLQVLPLQGVLAIDVGTAVVGMAPLFFIAIPQPQAAAARARPSLGADLRAGLRYVMGWPGLLTILLMATVINFLFNPASALLPILVTRVFAGNAMHLATVEMAFGLGMLAGGIGLSIWGGFRRRVVTSMVGLVALGVSFLLVGLTPGTLFWLLVGLSFVTAAMTPIVNGPLMATLQSSVAPEMQGRVFSLVGSLAGAMAPVGLIIAGPVADAVGVQAWYILGGIVCAGMGLAGFAIPAVMRLEDHPHAKAATAAAPAAELAPGA